MQTKVIRSSDRNRFWSKMDDSENDEFIEMLQLYTDTTGTTSNANSIVAYPVRFVFLNIILQFHRCLIEYEHTPIG